MDVATEVTACMVTVAQRLAAATRALAAAGVGTPRLDAEALLAAAWGLNRAALYARLREPVPQPVMAAWEALLERRRGREPLAYLVGRQEFWSLQFVVSPDVLIPRPETEQLVEFTLARLRARQPSPLTLCDLCSGSGCIAVALARELPSAEVWALDVSSAALAVAQVNGQRHRVAGRVRLLESDLLAAAGGRLFDAIVCNPPYVAGPEIERLQPEIAWEPRVALDGGIDGLNVIRRVLADAPARLANGGWLVMECGADQEAAVRASADAAGLREVSVERDYAGLPRVLLARR